MTYTPNQEVLDKYADVLVNFALNNCKGIKKGEVTEIPDNLVTFSSVISVYTFPFFSN